MHLVKAVNKLYISCVFEKWCTGFRLNEKAALDMGSPFSGLRVSCQANVSE